MNVQVKKMDAEKARKRIKVVPAVLAAFVLLLLGGYIILCKNTDIVIHGDGQVHLEAGDEYLDEGYHVTLFGKEKKLEVLTEGKVDNEFPGTYVIEYRVRWNPFLKVEKTVEVRPNCDPVESGGYFVKGLILVNKNHHVKKDYAPGENRIALGALKEMQRAAKAEKLKLPVVDGFRSYETQEKLYRMWVELKGEQKAALYSAEPGHSEHQTGLAFDLGLADPVFADWPEGKWLEENAHKYGFIIRYPKGKEDVTGYAYEPWHVRYVGKTIAAEIYEKGLTLEEYLGEE